MKKPKFKLTQRDETLEALVAQTDHRTLGVWAKACAERVLPYFEQALPEDARPRQALETLQAWIETGQFSMAVTGALWAPSGAGRGRGQPGASAARAAGQAVATARALRARRGPPRNRPPPGAAAKRPGGGGGPVAPLQQQTDGRG